MPDLLRQSPTVLTPEVGVDDALRLLAKLLNSRIVKAVPGPLSDAGDHTLAAGKLYSFGAVEGNATVTRADDSTFTLYEGVVLEFVTSEVIKMVTASDPGKVQIFVY